MALKALKRPSSELGLSKFKGQNPQRKRLRRATENKYNGVSEKIHMACQYCGGGRPDAQGGCLNCEGASTASNKTRPRAMLHPHRSSSYLAKPQYNVVRADDLGKTMLEINTRRQLVIESLTAAEIPEVLASGIADILVEAGFKQLAASTDQGDIAALYLVTPFKSSRTNTPGFMRFSPIVETLPALVLRYDQRIGLPEQQRLHEKHAYARLAAENHPADVLMLTPHDRVA